MGRLKILQRFWTKRVPQGRNDKLVAKRFNDARAGRPVALFKSHRDGIGDGDQRRDFIYVDDAVAVILWLLAHRDVSGLFNTGTGKREAFGI